MESLAIFVGYLLLAMLLSTIAGFSLAFIKAKWARILAVALSLPGAILGLILLSDSGNLNSNIILIAVIPVAALLFASYRLFKILKNTK
jgi:ABC-type glycerol-3-phosphate transport system permease component